MGTSTELLLGHVVTAQEHPTFTSVYPLGALESDLLKLVFPVLAMHLCHMPLSIGPCHAPLLVTIGFILGGCAQSCHCSYASGPTEVTFPGPLSMKSHLQQRLPRCTVLLPQCPGPMGQGLSPAHSQNSFLYRL